MFIIVIQYFENEVQSINKPTDPVDDDILKMDLINNDTDIENKMNFSKIKSSLKNLYDNTIVKNINDFTIIRKEVIIKKLVKNVLFNIYFTIYPSSVGGLACPLYTEDTCPSVPFQPSSDESGDSSPTLPAELIQKYKCTIESDVPDGLSKLCVNSVNNKYITKECEIMNGYGKTMCEHTEYEKDDGTTTACKYEKFNTKMRKSR